MPAQPRIHIDAAPLYPVCDPSPPGVKDRGALRVWTQSRPGKLSGSLARDITILRRGLDGHVQRKRALARRRIWIAGGGFGLGLFLIGVVSLFF